jgi:hypothetical protein
LQALDLVHHMHHLILHRLQQMVCGHHLVVARRVLLLSVEALAMMMSWR